MSVRSGACLVVITLGMGGQGCFAEAFDCVSDEQCPAPSEPCMTSLCADRRCTTIPMDSGSCGTDADSTGTAFDSEPRDAEDTASHNETVELDAMDTSPHETLEVDTSPDCDIEGGGGCTGLVWDPASSQCVQVNANEGGSCDDGSACTDADLCAEGRCVGTPRVDLNDWTALLPSAYRVTGGVATSSEDGFVLYGVLDDDATFGPLEDGSSIGVTASPQDIVEAVVGPRGLQDVHAIPGWSPGQLDRKLVSVRPSANLDGLPDGRVLLLMSRDSSTQRELLQVSWESRSSATTLIEQRLGAGFQDIHASAATSRGLAFVFSHTLCVEWTDFSYEGEPGPRTFAHCPESPSIAATSLVFCDFGQLPFSEIGLPCGQHLLVFESPSIDELPRAAGLAFADDGSSIVVSNFANGDFLAPGLAVRPVAAGSRDVSVSAFLPDGTESWTRTIGGSRDDEGVSISVDEGLAVTVAGITRSNPATVRDGDAVMATIPVSVSGGGNHPGLFLVRFDLEGQVEWAHRMEFGSLTTEPTNAVEVARGMGSTRLLFPLGLGVPLYLDLERQSSISSLAALGLVEFDERDELRYAHIVARAVAPADRPQARVEGALVPAFRPTVGVLARLDNPEDAIHSYGVLQVTSQQTARSTAMMLLNSDDLLECAQPPQASQ